MNPINHCECHVMCLYNHYFTDQFLESLLDVQMFCMNIIFLFTEVYFIYYYIYPVSFHSFYLSLHSVDSHIPCRPILCFRSFYITIVVLLYCISMLPMLLFINIIDFTDHLCSKIMWSQNHVDNI